MSDQFNSFASLEEAERARASEAASTGATTPTSTENVSVSLDRPGKQSSLVSIPKGSPLSEAVLGAGWTPSELTFNLMSGDSGTTQVPEDYKVNADVRVFCTPKVAGGSK